MCISWTIKCLIFQKPRISGLAYTNLFLCLMSVTREVSPGIFDTPRIVCCYKVYVNESHYGYEHKRSQPGMAVASKE